MSLTPSESEFQGMVRRLAAQLGWKSWHFADSRKQVGGRWVGDKGAAGFPDLCLAHPRHGLGFVELKTDKGRLRPAQRDALDALADAITNAIPRGAWVHVWRPRDVDAGVLERTLRGNPPERFYGWES